MDDIVQSVADRTGMPADQIRPVVQTVIEELKKRLPAPVAGQIDVLLASAGAGDALNQASQLFGGLMGDKE